LKKHHINLKKERFSQVVFGSLGFVTFLVIWSLLSYGKFVDAIFLPSPIKVLATLGLLFTDSDFPRDILATTIRVLIGFVSASLISIPLGICMANWKKVNTVFRPFVSFLRYIPVSGFIPLLILWAGIGLTQKVWVIFLGVSFHLTLLVADDAERIPSEILDTAKILSAGQLTLAWKVVLPYSMPAIVDNMRIMLGAAWSYIILAELVAATSGIGNMMIEAQRFLLTDRVMAGILTVGIIGILSDITFRVASRVCMPWTRFE
jgi:NitT/TauT family transport system permease protein